LSDILTPGKAAILYHAGAGRCQAADLIAPTRRRLQTCGWRIVACERTQAPNLTRNQLVPCLADRSDLLVVIAGDGTLRDVCAGLCQRPVPLPIGFVPTGNANVVARDQGIPLRPEAAITLLTEGRIRRLDIGTLFTRPRTRDARVFLAMVEIGFGARVVHLTQDLRYGALKALYRRWGDPVYAAAALKAFRSPAEPPFHIRTDSAAKPDVCRAAVIANTGCYAKGWAMAPEARMDDGRLDLVTRRRSTPGVWFRAFQAALQRRRPPPGFSHYRQGQHFACWSDRPLTAQMDGDPLPAMDWLEIGILPGRLRMITPP
jgi:diacylglycerol kinase (ATP)